VPKLLFVQHSNGSNFNLRIADEVSTVAELRGEIARHLDVSPDQVMVGKGTKQQLPDELSLDEAGIGDNSDIRVRVRVETKLYENKGAARLLSEVLNVLLVEDVPKVVFIGLGCYDHGHGEESIRRQQCPSDILTLCVRRGIQLNILLIDPGFTGHGRLQIYDIDPAWKPGVFESNVQSYSYATQRAEIRLYAFPLMVEPEVYGGESTRLNIVELTDFRRVLRRNGGCLICGNFYDESNKASLVIGDNITIGAIPWLTPRISADRSFTFDPPDDLREDAPLARSRSSAALSQDDDCCPCCILM